MCVIIVKVMVFLTCCHVPLPAFLFMHVSMAQCVHVKLRMCVSYSILHKYSIDVPDPLFSVFEQVHGVVAFCSGNVWPQEAGTLISWGAHDAAFSNPGPILLVYHLRLHLVSFTRNLYDHNGVGSKSTLKHDKNLVWKSWRLNKRA